MRIRDRGPAIFSGWDILEAYQKYIFAEVYQEKKHVSPIILRSWANCIEFAVLIDLRNILYFFLRWLRAMVHTYISRMLVDIVLHIVYTTRQAQMGGQQFVYRHQEAVPADKTSPGGLVATTPYLPEISVSPICRPLTKSMY